MKRALSAKDFLLEHTNPVIRYLILGDILFYGAAGLLAPIFAIFIVGSIEGGTPEVVGIATGIYLLTRSLGQIPAARLIDRICGDRDDFWFMFWGLVVASLVPLAYLVISTPLELYITQFVLGAALAFNWPSFYGLFTKYIPENKEATAWSIYQTFVDLGAGLAAAIGGALATIVGFPAVIIGVSVVGFVGALLLLPIRSRLRALNC